MALSRSKIKHLALSVLEDTDLTEEEAEQAADLIAGRILDEDPDAYDDEDSFTAPAGQRDDEEE